MKSPDDNHRGFRHTFRTEVAFMAPVPKGGFSYYGHISLTKAIFRKIWRRIVNQNSIYNSLSNSLWIYASFQSYLQIHEKCRRQSSNFQTYLQNKVAFMAPVPKGGFSYYGDISLNIATFIKYLKENCSSELHLQLSFKQFINSCFVPKLS